MTSDETETRKYQSRTAFQYQENKNHDYRRNIQDCSHEMRLRLGRVVMEQRGKITKTKYLSLENKLRLSMSSYSQLLHMDVKTG